MTPQQQLQWLRSPGRCLPALAEVHDQETGTFVKYNPYRLTHTLQREVLDYIDNPPLTDHGQTKWLTIVASRQVGKSLIAEYGLYPKVAYTPGWDHICIADTDARANYLHKRVHFMHQRWPEDVRSPTLNLKEVRQLTFDGEIGGKMRVLSAETGAVGIGQSPDSFHASECAFWSDFATSMMLIYPSMVNRNHCLAIFECTPWRAGDDWHEHVLMAKRRQGRNEYLFKPFWDGKLNARPWAPTDIPDQEELRLLERYGHLGLTLDNLAFRRFILESDAEIRRHPEMFKTFYPFDDISCWVTSALSAIPGHALEKHQNMGLVDIDRAYVEHIPPDRDSVYVIGVDPCGHAARDHAAFQVLEVCDGVWRQVAWYAAHTDPVEFTRRLFDVGIRYNKAMLYVENNGVGQGVLALLREWAYPRLFFGKSGQPGLSSTSQSLDQMTAWLIDGLMDELRLYDKQTVEQLMSYRHDKRVEEAPATEIIRGNPSKRRRERHHWDRVSALMFAIVGARRTATRYRQPRELPAGDNPIHSGLYKADARKAEWDKIQRQRRLASVPDTWYRGG